MFLFTIAANAAYHHLCIVGRKAGRQLYLRNGYFFKANCFAAFVANKMNMVIVVVASLAIVFAQGIQHRVVGGGYMMDDAFFYKSLQGAVNGYPVKRRGHFLFYIRIRKSMAGS